MVTTKWLARVTNPVAMRATVLTTRPIIWINWRCRGNAANSLLSATVQTITHGPSIAVEMYINPVCSVAASVNVDSSFGNICEFQYVCKTPIVNGSPHTVVSTNVAAARNRHACIPPSTGCSDDGAIVSPRSRSRSPIGSFSTSASWPYIDATGVLGIEVTGVAGIDGPGTGSEREGIRWSSILRDVPDMAMNLRDVRRLDASY